MKVFALFAALILPINAGELSLLEKDGKLSLRRGEKDILVYHMAEMEPPKVAKKAYRRSGFIHPLCTPKGEELTGIHPADHFHHMGLWHAWVKSKHGEDEPDFWNLGTETGRVRFSKLLKKTEEDGKVGFSVEQEQVAYKGEEKKETVVLREEFTVMACVQEGFNVVDYTVKQTNVSKLALEMPAYRYGGPLVIRGRHSWTHENSDVLTSEGKTRKDSHQSRAKWCAIYGPTDEGDATLVTFCHPENYDYPQRLRTWPEGAIFVNWAAAQENGFSIEPGKSMTWKYRLVTADEKLGAKKITALWSGWTAK